MQTFSRLRIGRLAQFVRGTLPLTIRIVHDVFGNICACSLYENLTDYWRLSIGKGVSGHFVDQLLYFTLLFSLLQRL